jgi:hypothetical protein
MQNRRRPTMLKLKLVALFFLLVLSVALTGCPQYVVRDETSVRMDHIMLQKIAKENSELLLALQAQSCQCTNGKWYPNSDCEKTAKMIIFLTVRFPWHMEMMLYNSGLTTNRPSETPPVMPLPETLCPTKVYIDVLGGQNA